MFNGNPHAPSTRWLNSIAGPGGYLDAEVGDEGKMVIQRDGHEYIIKVKKKEKE